MQSRDKSIIEHIVKYCEEIENEVNAIDRNKDRYLESNVYKNSFALCILQIGELVGLLSEEYKNLNKEVDWRSIKTMRNVVAHKYGAFDFDVLWETITEDVPELYNYCKTRLEAFDDGE